MLTTDARICATCNNPLSEQSPCDMGDGTYVTATIRDDKGVHHGACWGKPRRDRIAQLEAAVDDIFVTLANAQDDLPVPVWERVKAIIAESGVHACCNCGNAYAAHETVDGRLCSDCLASC